MEDIAEMMSKPTWASSIGTDSFGTYALLPIGTQVQMMRWIPAGTLSMGIAGAGRAEQPQHPVVISQGFWLGDSEVTQRVWQHVMGDNPSGFTGDLNRPVEEISWDSAQLFFTQLNQQTPTLKAQFPTEAQWEYACRAGTNRDDAGDLAAVSWHAANAGNQTHPVKSKPANAWGLFDMHGNVWEWCADFQGTYPNTEQTDPTGPTAGAYRISRGGCWNSSVSFCGSGQRGWDMQDTRGDIVGLRIAVPDAH